MAAGWGSTARSAARCSCPPASRASSRSPWARAAGSSSSGAGSCATSAGQRHLGRLSWLLVTNCSCSCSGCPSIYA
uniref:Uncharacterized protein n=1 Tax=Arundo donax TaxID=35708 RepID=A0A0A9HER6_ARUDO